MSDPATARAQPKPVVLHARDTSHRGHRPRGGIAALTVGAIGIVYGDIGTSPLYAVREIFFGHGGVQRTPDNVRGCISLVLWALTIVVAVKYVGFVLRAHNDGEGGVFALYGLLHKYKRRGTAMVLSALMLGAGLLFGDGVITPAISVLSAVEGLKVATPMFAHAAVAITVVILTALFTIQYKGSSGVGKVFGPVLICWFVVIGLLGARQIVRYPEILHAVNPLYGLRFLRGAGLRASLLVLGALMLVVTGGRGAVRGHGAYRGAADPRGLVRAGLSGAVAQLPGAGRPAGRRQRRWPAAKYSTAWCPGAMLYPMVVLATAATVIASQALISGAFSLASQAVALGLFPRLKVCIPIMHTPARSTCHSSTGRCTSHALYWWSPSAPARRWRPLMDWRFPA